MLYVPFSGFAMLGYLVGAALSDDGDLKQKSSHNFLFCLAHYTDCKATVPERLQVGMEALKRWQQHCGTGSRNHAHTVAVLDGTYGYSFPDDHIAVAGLLRLAALAVFVDNEPLMTRRKAKKVRLAAVENLLDVFAENWIDPLFAFILLVEVIVFQIPYSAVSSRLLYHGIVGIVHILSY